ncbi:MAG: LysR family transcriptional regulator [Gallionella sp.]|nr:LysR family transcriptional regulator [Gallionella sp.]
MIYHWTLQQLRLFEAVARHRSYTRAAAEIHLTQPAVYTQVKRLEENMGLQLIEQVGKKFLLTRAGEEVYETALEILSRLNALSGTLTDMKGKVAGPLKVAVVTSAKFFMPHFLGRFLREYPDVQPQLTVTNRARVIERLQGNQDDFVVMGQVPEHLALSVTPFMENILVPIAHPDHPLAKEKAISLERFAAERFLMRESGSGTRAATERHFAEHGLAVVNPYMELGSSEAVKQGVMAGLGVSVLSTSSLALEIETGHVSVLDVQGFPLRRMWYVAHLSGKQLGVTASVFLDFLVREGSRPFAAEKS